MAEDYRKQKRMREAWQHKDASLLADDPLDTGKIGFIEVGNQPLPEIKEVTVSEPVTQEVEAEKGMGGIANYYAPYGGSLSFDELDAYLETQEKIEHMESVTWQFRMIIENILTNPEVGFDEKSTMIQVAAEVYKMKLTEVDDKEVGFVEKLKELITGKKKEQLPDSTMGVIQTKDGSYRWFGHFTNNYKDREGDIISEEAHKEYVAYLKANPDRMPLFRTWHIPGTDREKEADFVDYFDGFMIASGPLTDKEAEQLEKAIAYDDGQTGMSHGMFVLQRDPVAKNIITRYRTFEVSDLPLANAANGFTGINVKEVSMTKDKLERLKASIGEEAANKVLDQITDNKEVLEELGVESKEEDVVKEEEEVLEESEAEEEVDEEKELTPEVKELAEAIANELGLKELSEILHSQAALIGDLQSEVKELKKEEDEKIAEKIEDKSLGALLWRPSADAGNVVEKEALLEEDGELEHESITENPETSWISEVM